jgi:two-component sensor histidine kinase
LASEPGELRNEFDAYIAEAKYLHHIPARAKTTMLANALQIAEKTQFAEGRADADEQLSALYDSLHNRDSALFYYRAYRSITDSLFSENNRRNTIVNESAWTIKRKELENSSLLRLTEVQKKQIAFKDILLALAGMGFLLSLVVVFLLYKSFQTRKLRDESQYKQKIAETEMQILHAQMNPHFFFNSLNSIENFIMQNEKKLASDYLNKFARFIRSVLDSSYKELMEVNKDLEAIQLYIDLEQMRFNHKFTYHYEVDTELLNGEYQVPALLVQPFLENAINHGIGPSEKTNLKICLNVKLKGKMICYSIADNGIGREQSRIYNKLNKPFHKSVGMKITQDRINIFNQAPGSTESVKIIDLFDEQQNAAGTKIEFAIKVVSHAIAQSHSGR